MPRRKNSVNTNCGHRQRFQRAETQDWSRSAPVAVSCVLTVFHNVDEFWGGFMLPKMDFESLSL